MYKPIPKDWGKVFDPTVPMKSAKKRGNWLAHFGGNGMESITRTAGYHFYFRRHTHVDQSTHTSTQACTHSPQ